jgi:hypothetical protein
MTFPLHAIFDCPACDGRGWVLRDHRRVEMAEHCTHCDGRGKYTLCQLASKLDEDEETVARLAGLRRTKMGRLSQVRPDTAERIFNKIQRIWEWPYISDPSSRTWQPATTLASGSGPRLFD